MKIKTSILFVLFIQLNFAHAQTNKVETIKTDQTSLAEQVDELFAQWDNDQSPGAAIAIVQDGSVIYKKGYGLANLEYGIPITPSSVFHVASISKQFTVFAILLLEKEGKLSMDDDIRKYIPELPDYGKKITLRHLASHTSGLRDQWDLLRLAGWRMDDVITQEHVLNLIYQQKELNFDPGENYLYSNSGYTLLAEAVSRVANMSFAQFTQKNIFEPLKMQNSLFYDDHEEVVKNLVYSYSQDSAGYKKSKLNFATVGPTNLYTTVEDLSLWVKNFSDLKVGDAAIVKKMNTPAVLNDGRKFGGALGQYVGLHYGFKEIRHGGSDAGYRSYMTRFPDQNFAVIVFGNFAGLNSEMLANKIIDIYLKDKGEIKGNLGKPKEEKALETIAVDPAILKTYVGNYYVAEADRLFKIEEKGGKLYDVSNKEYILPLIALSKNKFRYIEFNARMEFVENEGENSELIHIVHEKGTMKAVRIKDLDKINLAEFSGEYFSEELSSTYNLNVVNGKLVANHYRLGEIKLNPFKKDFFDADLGFVKHFEFVRNDVQEITGFKVSTFRVKGVYFKKII